MNIDVIATALGFVALLLGLLAVFLARRGSVDPSAEGERARILNEQIQTGLRAESETMRMHLSATERALAAAIQSGTTEALKQAFAQITTATTGVSTAMDAMRQAAVEEQRRIAATLDLQLTTLRESNEKRLAEIQKTVN
jgi:flagellar biosynthesis/type III secretory pathway protein FliH